MRTYRTSLVLAGALGVGGAAGLLLAYGFREPLLRRALERERELERITESLRQELERLTKEIGRRDDLLKQNAVLLDEERARQASPAGAPIAASETESSTSRAREVRGIALGSIEEAEAIFEEALARSDALALMELGAALLTMGEPGYEKLIALFGRLDAGGSPLWEDPLYIGPLARAMADHHEDVLRLGLYLHEKEPESLPGGARNLRKFLTEDGFSSMLLGFYGGGDAEIDRGYIDVYRRRLESDPSGEAVRGLAQIPGAEVTDALVACLRTAPGSILKELVIALAYRGDRRALPALESLRAGLTGEEPAGLDVLIDKAVLALR